MPVVDVRVKIGRDGPARVVQVRFPGDAITASMERDAADGASSSGGGLGLRRHKQEPELHTPLLFSLIKQLGPDAEKKSVRLLLVSSLNEESQQAEGKHGKKQDGNKGSSAKPGAGGAAVPKVSSKIEALLGASANAAGALQQPQLAKAETVLQRDSDMVPIFAQLREENVARPELDPMPTIMVLSKSDFTARYKSLEKLNETKLHRPESSAALARDVKSGKENNVAALLRVWVHQGQGLPAMDRGGTSDPFVVVRTSHSNYTAKTDVIRKTLSPVWEQKLLLPLSSLKPEKDPRLLVACYDFDRLSSPDFIGATEIDLSQAVQDFKARTNVTVVLAKHSNSRRGGSSTKERGSLTISYQVINKIEAERGVFGVPLGDVLVRGKSLLRIPKLVQDAIKEITERGLEIEGIGRLSGSRSEQDELKVKYDAGEEVDLSKVSSPNVIVGLLKEYLRMMPDPVLTKDLFPLMREALQHGSGKGDTCDAGHAHDETTAVSWLLPVLKRLPIENKRLLEALLQLFRKIEEKSAINMMTAKNVAIVFAPNFAPECPSSASPAEVLAYADEVNEVVQMFVTFSTEVFEALREDFECEEDHDHSGMGKHTHKGTHNRGTVSKGSGKPKGGARKEKRSPRGPRPKKPETPASGPDGLLSAEGARAPKLAEREKHDVMTMRFTQGVALPPPVAVPDDTDPPTADATLPAPVAQD